MSAVDLEATFRKHEPDPAVLGSNAMIVTTATRIRAAVIRTGSTPDQEAPVALLAQQLVAQAPLPPALVMDQAGGMGKTRAQVEIVSQGQTRMVAQVPQSCVDGRARFTPADFRVTGAGDACICPNGVTSRHVYHHSHDEGVEFRFFGGECCGCPLWERCRGPASKATSQRSVYLSAYHAHQREAAAFNTSEEGKGLLRGRWQVEPTGSMASALQRLPGGTARGAGGSTVPAVPSVCSAQSATVTGSDGAEAGAAAAAG